MFRVARKIRVGRETGNTHIFSFGLMFLENMDLVQTAEFDCSPWQTKGYFFLHAIVTVFWLNKAFIAVYSGERCGPWASDFI